MRYLFIVGCGHTGTSLMLSYFAACQGVYAIPEETNYSLDHTLDQFKNKFSQCQSSDIKYIVEKTPKHIYALKQICRDPDSAALIMVRNPVDVVASLIKRGKDISTSIRRYANDNLSWIKNRKDLKFLLVKYEDLVANESNMMRSLGSYLGLNLSDAIEDRLLSKQNFFGVSDSPKNTGGEESHIMLRNRQMRQPVSNQNGRWRERINRQQLDLIKRELGPLIKFLGYEECLDYTI